MSRLNNIILCGEGQPLDATTFTAELNMDLLNAHAENFKGEVFVRVNCIIGTNQTETPNKVIVSIDNLIHQDDVIGTAPPPQANGNWQDKVLEKVPKATQESLINKLDKEDKKTEDAQEYDLFGEPIIKNELLRDRFIEPPFSVLDTKNGKWQSRKKQWKTLGIQSEVGRHAECNATFSEDVDPVTGLNKYGRKPMSGISIFDPALCELMYRWFCKDEGTILDPFAGGSVRGIVANYLGYKYTGIDIREEQVISNEEQALKLTPDNLPTWLTGDSNIILDDLKAIGETFDFIFTCPPYADLEVYSDLEGDISNMSYKDFMSAYSSIIKKSCELLNTGGLACFVVGDVRDNHGYYIDFISHTKRCFLDCGMKLYNEAVLLQPLGTAMLRAPRVFTASKKLTKTHENVLIFKKP